MKYTHQVFWIVTLNLQEKKVLCVADMEKIEVISGNGKIFNPPIFLDRLDTAIKKGDWVVYYDVLYKFDDSFFLSRPIVDYKQLIKVKYE